MEKKSICSVEISRKLSEQSFKIDFFPFQVRLDEKKHNIWMEMVSNKT